MTKTDIYFIEKTVLINDELRLALCDLRDMHGEAILTSRVLKGKHRAIAELLSLPPVHRYPGKAVFRLYPEDLLEKSFAQIKIMIKMAIISNVPELTSGRAIGRFFDLDDHYVGWLMARATDL